MELRPLLAELFDQESDARTLLADIGRAPKRQSEWQTSAAFWEAELGALRLGAIRDGIPALIATAAAQYPGNQVLATMLAKVSTPDDRASARQSGDEDEQGRIVDKPDLPAAQVAELSQQFHTLTLTGSDRHDDFLWLVRRLVCSSARLCYATTRQSGQLPQSSVLIDDPGPRAAKIEGQLLAEMRDWGEGIAVEYYASEVQPYLLRQIVVSGTDNRRFALRNVPSTTRLSEIARAVLQHYYGDPTRTRRSRVRIAIDRIGADGHAYRLDSNRALSAAGVQDGDELRLAAEATAGVANVLWRESVLRARAQVNLYARDHPEFVIVETDDLNLPTRYTVEFRALGFAPPPDPEAWPLNPPLESEHRVTILLPASFPVGPPIVVFESAIFHPNVLPESIGIAPKGFVCLGALLDSYRPDMDFGHLCQMLVDMASYKQYETLDLQEDGEGYLNRPAARWAASETGQLRIADRGGLRLAEVSGYAEQDEDRLRSLDVTALDDRWEDYEDEG